MSERDAYHWIALLEAHGAAAGAAHLARMLADFGRQEFPALPAPGFDFGEGGGIRVQFTQGRRWVCFECQAPAAGPQIRATREGGKPLDRLPDVHPIDSPAVVRQYLREAQAHLAPHAYFPDLPAALGRRPPRRGRWNSV